MTVTLLGQDPTLAELMSCLRCSSNIMLNVITDQHVIAFILQTFSNVNLPWTLYHGEDRAQVESLGQERKPIKRRAKDASHQFMISPKSLRIERLSQSLPKARYNREGGTALRETVVFVLCHQFVLLDCRRRWKCRHC